MTLCQRLGVDCKKMKKIWTLSLHLLIYIFILPKILILNLRSSTRIRVNHERLAAVLKLTLFLKFV